MSRVVEDNIRKEIVARITAGERVTDVASRYGVSTKTIYRWLNQSAGGGDRRDLEISRLKRELDNAYAMLGRLTVELSDRKK